MRIKKIILIIGLLFTFASSAFALSYPRWSNFPLDVYIENDPSDSSKREVVQQAYQAWRTLADSNIKFFYRTKSTYKNTAQIRISFVDKLPQKQYYEINKVLSPLYYMTQEGAGFCYLYIEIKIRKTELDETALPPEKLYSIALQAAGSSLGIDCINSYGSAMSCDNQFDITELTEYDKKALDKVYKSDFRKRHRIFTNIHG